MNLTSQAIGLGGRHIPGCLVCAINEGQDSGVFARRVGSVEPSLAMWVGGRARGSRRPRSWESKGPVQVRAWFVHAPVCETACVSVECKSVGALVYVCLGLCVCMCAWAIPTMAFPSPNSTRPEQEASAEECHQRQAGHLVEGCLSLSFVDLGRLAEADARAET